MSVMTVMRLPDCASQQSAVSSRQCRQHIENEGKRWTIVLVAKNDERMWSCYHFSLSGSSN